LVLQSVLLLALLSGTAWATQSEMQSEPQLAQPLERQSVLQLAITALIVIPRMSSGDDAFEQAVRSFQSDPALGAWQSPTDGLLNLPGDRLLSTIPNVGTEPQ
jgi:hypothetical protein